MIVGVKELLPLGETELVLLTVEVGEVLMLTDTAELELGVMVADLLEDDETEAVLDVEADTELTGVIVIADEDVGVPDAGSVATSNPIDAGGTHNHNGAVGSLQGSAYTPN